MTIRPRFSTLVEVLRYRADHEPAGAPAYIYLTDGAAQEQRISFLDLDRQARTIAAHLQRVAPRGARAVLLYPPDLDYIAAFFGCLYAGVIAVPAYPPDPARLNRTLPRLRAIFEDADADLVLTTSEIVGMAQFLFAHAPDLEAKTWVATDGLDASLAHEWAPGGTVASDVAFLQYTSGSTGVPKGVVLTHDNLLHNLEVISNAFRIDDHSVGVSWLPPYHDMGLIGGILAPLYRGRPTALMSPIAFLQRPLRWLEAISRFRATISGGPNFAYDVCIRKVTPDDLERLDLQSWTLAFSGAEPVRADTLDNFVRTFGPRGFRRSAFYPCYGLAEATLIVSGGDYGAEPVVESVEAEALQADRVVRAPSGGPNTKKIVACGRVLADQRMLIVNPATFEIALPGDVGEVWLAGRSVAQGYWRRPDVTEENFQLRVAGTNDGPFLRTGDLAFLRDGELFITGRLKDLVIIRGRNYYPQDIERSAEASHPSLRRGSCAAFAVELQGQERLIVAVEIERRFRGERRRVPSEPPRDSERRSTDRRTGVPSSVEEAAKQTSSLAAEGPGPFDPDEVCDAIRRGVLEQHDLAVHEVVLVRPGAIPKTSSGKIQRNACREAYFDGSLEQVASNVISVEQTRKTSIRAGDIRGVVLRLSTPERVQWLEHFLKDQLAKALKTPVSRVDTTTPLSTFGLDSLLAVELAHRIEKRLGVVPAATAFLRDTTLRDLAATIATEMTVEPRSTVRASPARASALSAGQQALWFLHQLAPGSGAYNLSCAFRIVSEVKLHALRAAFEFLVGRHEALRTAYPAVDGVPTRRVLDGTPLDFEHRPDAPDDLQRTLAEEAVRPLDIEAGPLVRVRVYSVPGGDVVQLVMHHIGADLWSIVVLLNELGKVYDAICDRRAAALRPAEPTYADFVHWQQDYLGSPAGGSARDHWRRRHGGEQSTLALPTDRPRPNVQTYRGAAHTVQMPDSLVTRLRDFARAHATTPYVVLLSAFGALLTRYSGQSEVVVGSPVAGRPRAEFDRTVGYFVNVLPLRIDVAGDPPFIQLVASVRAAVLDALENQHYPLSHIVDELGGRRDPARSPLFQAFLAFEKTYLENSEAASRVVLGVPGAKTSVGRLTVEAVAVEHEAAQFDIGLVVVEGRAAMSARFQYNTDLFDAATIARMDEHLRRLLDTALADPRRRIGELELLTEAERVLVSSNDTALSPHGASCVHELIDLQAQASPHAVAVADNDTQLTYGELSTRAARLAGELVTRGVGPDVVVGVLLPRSTELVIALLAVLRAGGAYLPLDATHPPDRLSYMLEDSGAQVVLTTQALRSLLTPQVSTLSIDDADDSTSSQHTQPSSPVGANLAYVIYTSGSTGQPKGVMVTHAGLANYLAYAAEAYQIGRGRGAVVHSSVAFDLTVTSLFAPLLSGGRVRLVPEDDILALQRAIRVEEACLVKLTPAHLDVLGELATDDEPWGAETTMIIGGEALHSQSVEFWRAHAPKSRLVNEYGPTETVVGCCVYDATRGDLGAHSVPIGRPIANTQLYVLDRGLNPVPVRTAGELYIGGEGVARGYLGKPNLTSARFVPDGFRGTAGGLLYRTGDVARFMLDLNLEYLGRSDHQVKVRGFRIELGEIEASLLQHGAVREAVVIAREDAPGDKRLAAYVVAKEHPEPSAIELRTWLDARLPEYMVPGAFVVLAALPLTSNGKIDRRALPAPLADPAADYVAPRSPLEQDVCNIVQDVLRVERVGVHANFFELGGHSLLLTQVANRIRAHFDIDISLTDLYESATVAKMALAVTKARARSVGVDLDSLLTEVESLSPEELDRLLEGEVKHG
jgi:amino acid adenylation domain-containing protein